MAYKRTNCINTLCSMYQRGLCELITEPRNEFEARCAIRRESCYHFVPKKDNGTNSSEVAKYEETKTKVKGVKL